MSEAHNIEYLTQPVAIYSFSALSQLMQIALIYGWKQDLVEARVFVEI